MNFGPRDTSLVLEVLHAPNSTVFFLKVLDEDIEFGTPLSLSEELDVAVDRLLIVVRDLRDYGGTG